MKTATIKVNTYDYYDDGEEDYVIKHEMPLNAEDMEELLSWTSEKIRQFMHDNCVGLHDSVSDNKYIPCIEIGKLSVSCQINYYVWKLRTDKLWREKHIYDGEEFNRELEKNTTEEEFNEVLPDAHSLIDVKVTYDGARCFLGQMTLSQVAEIFSELALNLETEFDD